MPKTRTAVVPRTRLAPRNVVGLAVVTRDRRDVLMTTLDRLRALPQRPPIAVVDNGSRDGTAAAVRRRFPDIAIERSEKNLGAAARTLAAKLLDTPIVAFADDDSWWANDALDRLASAFADHPGLGLVAARVLVGPEGRLDPTCELMRASPLRDDGLPGPRVLGFVACGAAVRREAFLAAGGFESRFGIGSEERLLSIDLAAAGWQLCYLDAVVAHHHPSGDHPRPGREALVLRNDLWTLWLRRPLRPALAGTARTLASALRDPTARRALAEAARGAPWLIRNRRTVPAALEFDLRRLELVARNGR
jgi:GT2 family glycosyltransferase